MVGFVFPSGRKGWIHGVRGTVSDAKRWTETHVRSSGGGGRIDPKYGGNISAPTVSSTVVEKGEIWVRTDSGKEVQINAVLPMTTGHNVSILWGNFDAINTGPHIYWNNFTSGKHSLMGKIGDNFLLSKEDLSAPRKIFWTGSGIFLLLITLYLISPGGNGAHGSAMAITTAGAIALSVCWIIPVGIAAVFKGGPRQRRTAELLSKLEALVNRSDVSLDG